MTDSLSGATGTGVVCHADPTPTAIAAPAAIATANFIMFVIDNTPWVKALATQNACATQYSGELLDHTGDHKYCIVEPKLCCQRIALMKTHHLCVSAVCLVQKRQCDLGLTRAQSAADCKVVESSSVIADPRACSDPGDAPYNSVHSRMKCG